MKPRAICTAVLVPGAVTQRVDRVIRATPSARAVIAQAYEIAKARNPSENPRRMGLCEPHPASADRPFRVVSVSIYCDELQALDKLVARRKREGQSSASRSKVIRAAVKALIGAEQ